MWDSLKTVGYRYSVHGTSILTRLYHRAGVSNSYNILVRESILTRLYHRAGVSHSYNILVRESILTRLYHRAGVSHSYNILVRDYMHVGVLHYLKFWMTHIWVFLKLNLFMYMHDIP